MYFRTKTLQSTAVYWQRIKRLKRELETADAVLIGAGAGLSTSAGLTYGGTRFLDYFAEYAEKYGLQDMYSAGFYPYDTLEEYWAYWSRHIQVNRYLPQPRKPYTDLLNLVRDTCYFVITTNVDHLFQKNGFDRYRLFDTQGDYGRWQCARPCCQETYENEHQVMQMVQQQRDMKIPTRLIPYCPHCGAPMTMNLRIDGAFVEDSNWHRAASRYRDFISQQKGKHILHLELGVGYNTPGIIKYPFWQMTAENPNAVYACINVEDCGVPQEITNQTIGIQGDIKAVIEDLYTL